jgi:hypothetical protein
LDLLFVFILRRQLIRVTDDAIIIDSSVDMLVVEMGHADEGVAGERGMEGVEDDGGQYREGGKAVAGVPGGKI